MLVNLAYFPCCLSVWCLPCWGRGICSTNKHRNQLTQKSLREPLQGCSEHKHESLAECIDYAHTGGFGLLPAVGCMIRLCSQEISNSLLIFLSFHMCAELKPMNFGTANLALQCSYTKTTRDGWHLCCFRSRFAMCAALSILLQYPSGLMDTTILQWQHLYITAVT